MIIYKKFDLADYSDSLIVTDCNIANLYSISGNNVYLLPRGEEAKSFAQAENLCKWFLSKNLQRSGKVVAVGGGSIGDTVGFACSVYKRGGAHLTHVPTTLLAQIDSSIGGKTALDILDVKNAAGTYYNADTVIDVNFLKTLDDVQLKSGLGELLKYRMLCSDVNKAYSGQINEQVIRACVNYKQSLCAVDPYDNNVRRKLNFGHTLGHAMEITYNIPHGVAVANGLYYETLLAQKLNKCSEKYFTSWTDEIMNSFEIFSLNEKIINLTVADKKNALCGVCFMLPSDFAETYLTVEQVTNLLC